MDIKQNIEKITGILLIQLGTPASPATKDVRAFLRAFLKDRRVMDVPWLLRNFLLYFIILPFRSKKSAANYRKIWTKEGSPLMVHSQNLSCALQKKFDKIHPGEYLVKFGMRYGEPSIPLLLKEFSGLGIQKLKVVPLFPQYSSATTGSVLEKIFNSLSSSMNIPGLEITPFFYSHPLFIKAYAGLMEEFLKKEDRKKSEFHFVFSFHGLPERQIINADPSGSYCLKSKDCCQSENKNNSFCYKSHCLKTANLLAKALKLSSDKWSWSFQSRLGRAKWLTPYTTELLKTLAGKGEKKVALVSPSFVADGLETLEELGIQESNNFKSHGGEELLLFPCLNSHTLFVDFLSKMISGN